VVTQGNPAVKLQLCEQPEERDNHFDRDEKVERHWLFNNLKLSEHRIPAFLPRDVAYGGLPASQQAALSTAAVFAGTLLPKH